jgi:putative ABC transport system permease protein
MTVLRTTLAGLKAHARRLAATALAVILGVGFVAGTLIFSDTAKAGFYDTFARTAKNVDVAVERDKNGPLTQEQLARVREVKGVKTVDARIVTSLPLLGADGKPVTNFGRAGYAISTDGDPAMRAYDVDGALPADSGEAVLDKETAAHQKLTVGGRITIADRQGAQHTYQLVGLIDFGVSKTYSGSSVVGLPAAEIQRLAENAEIDEIVIAAAGGVSQADLARAVQAAVGRGAQVVTGDQRRQDLANDATSVATQFAFILLIFGAISLVVAVFVIYNTFAILLAQRVRETALLRCVGATRRQVFQATVLESAVVGLGGGIIGVLFGIGVAGGLFLLFDNVLHAGIPSHTIVLGPVPVVVGLAIGLVATIAAALIPAFRATRTSPLAALRDQPTAKVTGRTRRIVRLVIALLIGAAGITLTVAGSGQFDAQTGTFIVIAGGIVAFLSVLVAAPLFVGPLIALFGLPARAVAGTPGRVAVANTRRNPGRTAVTAASLMIGVGLMALFSVIIASIRQTAENQIVGHYPVDYVVNGVQYADFEQAPVPAAFAASLHGDPKLATVAEVRVLLVRVDNQPVRLAAVSTHFTGTPDAATGTVILDDDYHTTAQTLDFAVGHQKTSLHIAGRQAIEVPGARGIDGVISWEQMTALDTSDQDSVVLVKAASGVSAADSRDVVDRAASAYPLVQVSSIADLTSDLDTAVNSLIGLFAGLLATAVLIALAGIANTLSLSVVERTRESATLRAIGLTRSQLRGTLLVEAVLMGLVGAVAGVAFGLIYGPLVVREAFKDIGPTIVVQWTWLAGLVMLAALASCLAAVLPARRAARASIVSAMADL